MNNPFQLSLSAPAPLSSFLHERGLLLPGENILRLEKPGEGNMNCVARAWTEQRSFIVKQARPWVEKYPSIAAPIGRALVEARFYQAVQGDVFLSQAMPQLLAFDPENHFLLLEDLGESADCLHLYSLGAELFEADAAKLGEYLSRLHRLSLTEEESAAFPDNLALRRLNHEHVFHFPYRNDTGFDLDTVQVGLQAAAQPYRQDGALKKRVEELGSLYLSPGKTLLHGDYYPGSWLLTRGGAKVIDPEFCFMGCPEFDFGVMAAHLEMSLLPAERRRQMLAAYRPPQGFDTGLAKAFTGAEMLRRLIGLAQLPLQRSLAERASLLEEARAFLLP